MIAALLAFVLELLARMPFWALAPLAGLAVALLVALALLARAALAR